MTGRAGTRIVAAAAVATAGVSVVAASPAQAVSCHNGAEPSYFNGWYTPEGPSTQYVSGVSADITVRWGDICSPVTVGDFYSASSQLQNRPNRGYAQSGYDNKVGGPTVARHFFQYQKNLVTTEVSGFDFAEATYGSKPTYKSIYSTDCVGTPSACIKMYVGSTLLGQTNFNPDTQWSGYENPAYFGETGDRNSLTPGESASTPAVFSGLRVQIVGGNMQDFQPSDRTTPMTNTAYDFHTNPGTCFDGTKCFSIWH